MNGALDFAGGTVVHISSGVSALICALVLGARKGYGQDDMRPHNLTYTALGAAMLWVGWFGFNAGSELASDGLTTSAFAVTHFSAAAGVLGWAGWEWLKFGKPSLLGAASGCVAGLVCITPAAGFVQPMPALLMGAAAGVICAIACGTVKKAFGYDDSLDAFGVHGVGGTLGAAAAVFAAQTGYHGVREGRKIHLTDMATDETRAIYTALSNTLIGFALALGGLMGLLAEVVGVAATTGVLAVLCLAGAGAALGLDEVQKPRS